MKVLRNIGYLATCKAEGSQADIHPITHAALVWNEKGIISWVGAESDLPEQYEHAEIIDAGGKLVIPGLIDCHTHLGFAGWRAQEFEMRILGKSYLDMEQAGGGIVSTVKKTREATSETLKERALSFLSQMSVLGITTVECKSGYGLDTETELKILRMYKALSTIQPIEIVPTFLGAHTFPPEFKDNRDGYVDLIINEMLPAVASEKLAQFCDIFVETSAFSIEQARKIFNAATRLGLQPKIHADQFTDSGGALLAAEVGAVSADHLECTGDAGIHALKEKKVIAVMLPFASLYTNQKPAQARRFIDAGVPVAVATDFNPGSAPSYHLPLAMFLSCTLNRMTPQEVLKGATIYAARAIARDSTIGSLEIGKKADFAIIDATGPDEWMYHVRETRCLSTFKRGQFIHSISAITVL